VAQAKKPLFSRKEIAFMTVPLLFVASLWIYPEPMFLVVYAAGRAGTCPLPQTLAAKRVIDRLNETTLSIAGRSMIEEKDAKAGLWRWSTPYGTFWAPPETSVPFLLSEQSTRVYGDGERRVRKGDVVLDCGANIGTFTREALGAGASLVVAIEPSARNVEALRRSFATEIGQGKVIVYPKGVWHREEELKFFVYDNSALDSFVMPARPEEKAKPKEVRLPVDSIDRIVAELKLERIDFIKMDVEGAERHAVTGAQATIAKFHPRMSLAMENLPDDQYVVPPLVMKAWPGYRQECGRCSMASNGLIQPDVVFFY
jgi:FkbM family methyltransferase